MAPGSRRRDDIAGSGRKMLEWRTLLSTRLDSADFAVVGGAEHRSRSPAWPPVPPPDCRVPADSNEPGRKVGDITAVDEMKSSSCSGWFPVVDI